MAVTFRDYSGDLVEAAYSVLLELVRLLGEYRDDLVVVGGWVPQLILPAEPLKHVGSIDVDLAFNHRNLQDAGYATLALPSSSPAYTRPFAEKLAAWQAIGSYLPRNSPSEDG